MSAAFDGEIADNRTLWDAWTAIHTTGDFYDVQRFRDDPADVRIEPWERAEVGDIAGKRLLHLQCHFGLDTLSWAPHAAPHVTGDHNSEPAKSIATAWRGAYSTEDTEDAEGAEGGETTEQTGGFGGREEPEIRGGARISGAGFRGAVVRGRRGRGRKA